MEVKQVNLLRVSRVLLIHLLFWVLVVIYLAWGFGQDVNPNASFINALYFLPGHIILVYSLLYFLVPRYLLQRKFWQFFLGFLIVLVICTSYTVLAQLSVNSIGVLQGATIRIDRNVLLFVHIGAIATSIELLKHWYLQQKLTLEAEQQKTVAELNLLKAQLHPHFLFNTLNNLYSHTLEFSPKSPEIVLKLSGLLCFMIYENNSTKIPLVKEMELLKNYISLEQLRYGDRLEISVSVTGDIEKYQIAPMLLLPFLENAFKHGTSKQIDQCWISFNLSVENSIMSFKLINSIEPNLDGEVKKIGGLGFQNVIKRLQLLYKDNYLIETVKMEDVFVVDLELALETL